MVSGLDMHSLWSWFNHVYDRCHVTVALFLRSFLPGLGIIWRQSIIAASLPVSVLRKRRGFSNTFMLEKFFLFCFRSVLGAHKISGHNGCWVITTWLSFLGFLLVPAPPLPQMSYSIVMIDNAVFFIVYCHVYFSFMIDACNCYAF